MKRLFYLLLLLSSHSVFAAGDYMDVITKEICSCASKIDSTQDQERIYLQLGLCMLNASKPYAKEIKKDYKIDLTNFNEGTGEKLGSVFGVKIALVCPDMLLRLNKSAKTESNDETKTSSADVTSVKGKIVNVEENQFILLYVEDANGKTSKYIWLTFFPTSKDVLNNPKSLLNKNVVIEYREEEFLDPRIKEYIKYRIISNISIEE